MLELLELCVPVLEANVMRTKTPSKVFGAE